MQVRFDGNTQVVLDGLGAIPKRVVSLQPAMKVAAAQIDKLIDDSFRQQRSPSGVPWDPLKKRTKKSRRKGRKNQPEPFNVKARILQDTGVLRRSWQARGEAMSIVFGTNVPYAGPHQRGTKDGSIPARQMAPVEFVGTWRLILRGPAGRAFATIRKTILRYVATGKVS